MPWDEYRAWVEHYCKHPPAFVWRDRLDLLTARGIASRTTIGGRPAKVEDIASWRKSVEEAPEWEDWMADLDMTGTEDAEE